MKSRYSPELEESFDQVLATLEMLRGVQDPKFNEDPDVYRKRRLGQHRSVGSKACMERLRTLVMQPSSRSEEEGQK